MIAHKFYHENGESNRLNESITCVYYKFMHLMQAFLFLCGSELHNKVSCVKYNNGNLWQNVLHCAFTQNIILTKFVAQMYSHRLASFSQGFSQLI